MFRYFLILGFSASLAMGNNHPNIVFFFSDDQTKSTIGCYGNEVIQTPNIDRLARDGTKFENAFVSQSICWVSRTSILTGLTGRSFGTPGNHDVARPETVEVLYSDKLREVGYRTGYFGKWHARMPSGFRREDHFDEFEAIGRSPFYKKQADGTLRHETDLIVDRGIEFLAKQPKDKPFALNLWFNAGHAEDDDRRPGIGHFPWPRGVDGLYEDISIEPPRLNNPAIFDDQPEFLKTTINRERYFWRWNTPEKYQTNIKAYYRMITGIDSAIGRFIAALEESGLAENTIIVFSADNGFHMGNRGFAGKWSHYEESLRVPLIIFDPRPQAKRGQVSEAVALNLDLPATFLDWAGVDVPFTYQGKSLQPILNTGSVDDWRKESFHEHFAVRHRIPAFEGVRTADFKYARYIDHGGYEFLHDLKNDADELVNLASDPAFAEVLSDLRKRTDEHVAAYGGPLLPLNRKFDVSTVPHPKAAAEVSFRPNRDGFVNLFNGKNLAGWEGDREIWAVKDGVITGTTDGKLARNHFLTWTGSTIRNFDLRMKVKINENGQSGIRYRGQMRPEIGLDAISGYQCDIAAESATRNGMLSEELDRGILAHSGESVIIDAKGQPWVVAKSETKSIEPGVWRDIRVLVQSNHIQHWIDEHQTADVLDFDETGRSLEGVLGLQVCQGPPMEVQFKDIRIRHLSDDLPLQDLQNHPIPPGAIRGNQ